jgi:hypothetical protein
MVECPAARALDLDLVERRSAGKQPIASGTTQVFHSLQSLLILLGSHRSREQEGLGWLAG